MQTIKHRTMDAISKLPDTAGIKEIEILLKKIAKESKKNLPEPAYSDQTESPSGCEKKSVKSIFGLLKHYAPKAPVTVEEMEAAIQKRRCERAFK